MLKYDSSKTLYSIHIPKTAGTSFRHVLEQWFGSNFYTHYRHDGFELVRHETGGEACIHGHFNPLNGAGLKDYYPHAEQFITVLRHPFERRLSLWHFTRQLKKSGANIPMLEGDPSFSEWLDRQWKRSLDTGTTNMLAMMPVTVNENNIDEVLENFFVAVAFTEDMKKSVEYIGTALGKPPLDVPVSNVTQRDNQNHLLNTDYQSNKQMDEDRFPLEYRIYESARRIFWR